MFAVPDELPDTEVDRWTTLAGPIALGRSILLSPDDPVPTPWADVQRIHLSDESLDNPQTLRAVRRSFLTRARTVYEVRPGTKVPAKGTDRREVRDVRP